MRRRAKRSAARLIDRVCDAPPIAAYGVRLLSAAYLDQPMMRVRRQADGAVRDIYYDAREILDVADLLSFANGGTVEVLTLYDLTGNQRHLQIAGGGVSPQVVVRGQLVANQAVPGVMMTGTARMMAYMAFNWNAAMVFNCVMVAGPTPSAAAAYIIGADTSVSGYRDLGLFVAQNSTFLGFGEDFSSMTPATSTLEPNTASIITAIRNATGATPRGYIVQNGVITSTFTAKNPALDIQPNRLVIGRDADASGVAMPLGWGFQEIIVFNGAQPPSNGTMEAIHASQGNFFNIPLYGTLAWPASVSRTLLTSAGASLVTSTGAKLTIR